MVSILHISDLHRDGSPSSLANDYLLNSLIADHDRYTADQKRHIPTPQLIVVSGDLIQGVKQGLDKPADEIRRQYEETHRFLSKLAARFLDGDKGKVIIVPGNHDVSSYHFYECIRSIALDDSKSASARVKAQMAQQFLESHSTFRWEWDTQKFYEIHDRPLYDRRFEHFADFYSRFYDDHRTFSLDPSEQFDIFDYPEYSLTFVGFNSCHDNDLLNRHAEIHPSCVARSVEKLRDISPTRLRCAVWHHSTYGPPLRSDYMDASILQNFIDTGFTLGFHGHQHRFQFVDAFFEFGQDRSITVVSAGTLCGGPNALPSGRPRGYNILELAVADSSATLHVREMVNDSFSMPIWGPGQIPQNGQSFIDVSLRPPAILQTESMQKRQALAKSEDLIHQNQHEAAIEILQPLAPNDGLARALLLECYLHTLNSPDLIELITPPQSVQEVVLLADSLWGEGKKEELRELIESSKVTTSNDPSIVQIRTKYAARLSK